MNEYFWTVEQFGDRVYEEASNPDWIPTTIFEDPLTKFIIKFILIQDRKGNLIPAPK